MGMRLMKPLYGIDLPGDVRDHVALAAFDATRDGFFDVSVGLTHVRSSVDPVLSE
jgi:hypothetical protein